MNHLSSPFSITSLVFRFAACCGAGNRFQCGDLPANDESYELYRCGSQDYNSAAAGAADGAARARHDQSAALAVVTTEGGYSLRLNH